MKNHSIKIFKVKYNLGNLAGEAFQYYNNFSYPLWFHLYILNNAVKLNNIDDGIYIVKLDKPTPDNLSIMFLSEKNFNRFWMKKEDEENEIKKLFKYHNRPLLLLLLLIIFIIALR